MKPLYIKNGYINLQLSAWRCARAAISPAKPLAVTVSPAILRWKRVGEWSEFKL